MIRKTPFLLLGFVIAGSASAHDFWLQPETFRLETPGPVVVQARIGHRDDLSIWDTAPSRIVALSSVGPDGITDQQTTLDTDPAKGILKPDLSTPGLHILTLTSTHSVSDLPAKKFNDYVEEEGVRPILEDRMARGAMESNGREIYSRRAKSLILVGDVDSASDGHVTRPLVLTLEIVPLANPMRASADRTLEYEVRYRGVSVAGALVHAESLSQDNISIKPMRTDTNGRATFSPDTGGAWMLHTVWSAPIFHDSRADYDSIFSSLTFSFDSTD